MKNHNSFWYQFVSLFCELFTGKTWNHIIEGKKKTKGNYLDGYAKPVCGYCGKKRTPEGHDGCIGTLPDVMNACCGHGEDRVAYVQFWDGSCIAGEKALDYIKLNQKGAVLAEKEGTLADIKDGPTFAFDPDKTVKS